MISLSNRQLRLREMTSHGGHFPRSRPSFVCILTCRASFFLGVFMGFPLTPFIDLIVDSVESLKAC